MSARAGAAWAIAALLLAGCGAQGAPEPAPTVTVAAPVTVTPSATVTVTEPAPTRASSSPALSDDELDETVYLALLVVSGVDMGSSTDAERVALGREVCRWMDEGAVPNLAWAMLIVDDAWPDDAHEDAPLAIALAASRSLCRAHEAAVDDVMTGIG